MMNDDIDAKIDALREQLFAPVEQHRKAVAERVSDKGVPARHAAKRKAAIDADLARYAAALRAKYGVPAT